MSRPLPHYYSQLAPFRSLFLSGNPILTYHHVGPRARGARLKGLYVSAKLFAAQMTELAKAGFVTASLDELGAKKTGTARLFVTFDDGFTDVLEHALPVLKQHRFTSIQFLVSDLLGKTNQWQEAVGDVLEPLMNESQIREWLAAGQGIGSHTRTHPHLTQISTAAAREEITGSKKALEDRFGISIRHFCYPYGDWNASVRELVQEAGYQTACTTKTALNAADTPAFELSRFTARYPSRNLKAFWSRLFP